VAAAAAFSTLLVIRAVLEVAVAATRRRVGLVLLVKVMRAVLLLEITFLAVLAAEQGLRELIRQLVLADLLAA
jgi:hypothetical protein